MHRFSRLAGLHSVIAAIWLGMLIGVSFIATPVKFQADGLSLPVALDVGRLTFGVFNRVEWLLAALLVVCAVLSRAAGWRRVVVVGLVMGLASQSFWLLPVLDGRVEAIIAGQAPDSSPHHLLYAGIEVLKALGLFALAVPVGREDHATLSTRR